MDNEELDIPAGMLEAASNWIACSPSDLHNAIHAALLWQRNNPRVPTVEQMEDMKRDLVRAQIDPLSPKGMEATTAVEWQRRMYRKQDSKKAASE